MMQLKKVAKKFVLFVHVIKIEIYIYIFSILQGSFDISAVCSKIVVETLRDVKHLKNEISRFKTPF